jgi:hypothetical protein
MMLAIRILAISLGFAALAAASGDCGTGDDFDLMVRSSIGQITSDERPTAPVDMGGSVTVGRKSVARAMLLSAVLPGLGQMYAGGRRGYAVGGTMAAVDVLSAWLYFDNNRKGDDRKSSYQVFARDHYSRDRFVKYVRDTIVAVSPDPIFEPCTDPGSYDSSACWVSIHNVFPLSDRNDAAYYEQIGDEYRFVFGWDDWYSDRTPSHADAWIDWDPYTAFPTGIPTTSANREKYRGMKAEADDFYGRADRYAWVMVVGRVVSMIDAAILVKLRNRDLAAIGDNPRLTFKAGLRGGPNFKVGLKMRF